MIHLSRLGCNFVALVLAVSAVISVKEAFRGKKQQRPVAVAGGGGVGGGRGLRFSKRLPEGLLQPYYPSQLITQDNDVIEMQLSHWQTLVNSTGPKL